MVHRNSKEVWHQIMQDGSKDKKMQEIFRIIFQAKEALSDYAVLQKVKPGSDNLNLVRPRITELHQIGRKGPRFEEPKVVEEGMPTKSHYKNTNVRTTRLIMLSEPSLF